MGARWALKVIPIGYVDVTGERETAEFISKTLLETINDVEERCGVKVVATVTDGAANCRKGRRLISEQRPDILGFDCTAHQLLLGVYLKASPRSQLRCKRKAELPAAGTALRLQRPARS